MSNFDGCEHVWEFHIDAGKSGLMGCQSMFLCKKCDSEITLQEKYVMDQAVANKQSLKIQERQSKIAMWATIISAIVLIIAFMTFLFGDRVVK